VRSVDNVMSYWTKWNISQSFARKDSPRWCKSPDLCL